MKTQEQYFDFIKKQTVSFISTIDENGFPNMKAMLMPRKIENNCFYFSTNTSSMRVEQLKNNSKASIYFYTMDQVNYEGIMLIGTAESLHDQQIKDEIWRDGDTMYYKEGVTDPDYCVIKFTATKGRHFDDGLSENFDVK